MMPLRVQVISDFVCPWCYLGKRQLEIARQQAPPDLALTVSWHPFQLDPGLPREGVDRQTYLTLKLGSRAKAEALDAQVVEAGFKAGILFRFDWQRRQPNTADCHRLVWLAGREGCQEAVVEAFFRGYFCDGIDLSLPSNLIEIASQAGLTAGKCERLLAADEGAAELLIEEQSACNLGVSAIPCWVVNHQFALHGVQSPEALRDCFRAARLREAGPPVLVPPAH
jgi:predicted DsbA family dithiol-disulfide isomerase